MPTRVMLAAFVILVCSIPQFAQAETRVANKGETCTSLRRSCLDTCNKSGSSGGGALHKKCLEECGLSLSACNKSGIWNNGDLHVNGLPTGK